jgi:hypothetical protein
MRGSENDGVLRHPPEGERANRAPGSRLQLQVCGKATSFLPVLFGRGHFRLIYVHDHGDPLEPFRPAVEFEAGSLKRFCQAGAWFWGWLLWHNVL